MKKSNILKPTLNLFSKSALFSILFFLSTNLLVSRADGWFFGGVDTALSFAKKMSDAYNNTAKDMPEGSTTYGEGGIPIELEGKTYYFPQIVSVTLNREGVPIYINGRYKFTILDKIRYSDDSGKIRFHLYNVQKSYKSYVSNAFFDDWRSDASYQLFLEVHYNNDGKPTKIKAMASA